MANGGGSSGTTGEKGKGDSETGQKRNPTKGESEVWKKLDNVKGQNRKTSGTGKGKKYYEWDHTHNDIEVYDNRGNHLGSIDPTTGEMYKPAVPGRTIKIN
ncbi:colicin E3/pyocin S6 family cytotoxin [Holdemania filiformis]|uniref:colicin E3/pyocin S6 family cytotoxin n=1 Tax=Holdemania filiformis TaxID=61171 RepID=UPI003A4E319D